MQITFISLLTFLFAHSLFADVTFSPDTKAEADINQVRVQFETSMMKTENPFTLTCDPHFGGHGNWADNNTTWVFNINSSKDRWGDPLPLPGGASCEIVQTQDLESVDGKKWTRGSLKHKFVVKGPNVVNVHIAPGFNGLREDSPVMMVIFDGAIDTNTLYNSSGSFVYYPVKEGLPSEKLALSPVPADKVEGLYNLFNEYYWLGHNEVSKDSKNWAFVTLNRNLVPGVEVRLSLSNIVSAYASKAVAADKDVALKVRKRFQAEVDCGRMDNTSALCSPESTVSVQFNAKVDWQQAKGTYLEYTDATSGQTVKMYPNEQAAKKDWLGWAKQLLSMSPTSDFKVESIRFAGAQIKPKTTAQLVFPSNMLDVDQRTLTTRNFDLQFGSYSEVIKLANGFTVMESQVAGNTGLPFRVMNLNQSIQIRKTSSNGKDWTPITNLNEMVELYMAYNDAMERYYDDNEFYHSPLDLLGLATTTEETTMSGPKNKNTYLTMNFGSNAQGSRNGLYVMEVKSELSHDKKPKYNLTLVTDLNLHVKQGRTESMVWVTSYSSGLPISSASVVVYGCNQSIIAAGLSDANGIFQFKNPLKKECSSSNWILSASNWFVGVMKDSDVALTNTTTEASPSMASSAPGVEYFYSDINDQDVKIHTVVGVNLVKPGQKVPIQLTATVPNEFGFHSVSDESLPSKVRVRSNNNYKLYYEFPVQWENGQAEFVWNVPKSVELGSYSIVTESKYGYNALGSTDIEVSEFKVPTMTGALQLEKGPLVKPDSLKVTGSIRYANGVGAKNQETEVSYYFSKSSLSVDGYTNFDFVRGAFGDTSANQDLGLPTSDQVAILESVQTDKDGLVNLDLATQSDESGTSVSELISGATQPYTLVVRMRYQDQKGEFQTVSTSQKVYNSKTYLGTRTVTGPLETATLELVSLGVDGEVYTDLTDLDLKVYSIETNVIGEEVFGGIIKNVFEEEVKATSWNQSCQILAGVAQCAPGKLDAGHYIFAAQSNSTGQQTYSRFTVDNEGILTADQDYYYFDESSKGLLLATDKADYKGGDFAKVSFDSPFSQCTALVTTERGDVVSAFVDSKACENGFVNVAIDSKNAPNIFTSVYLVTNRANGNVTMGDIDLGKPTYRVGYSNLKIDWSNYALDVNVEMDKDEYKPGEEATAYVTVQAKEGTTVNTDVTLIVLEEKILELKQNDTMMILDALMGQRGHGVSLSNNYNVLDSVANLGGAVAEAASVMDEAKGGEEGGSGSEMETFQRKLFDSLVAWQTHVPVVDGKAAISFKLNDKLTKFKVFVVAKDVSNKFGTGNAAYLAAQEVQSFSNLPSVARTGDQFPAIVNVQNNGKQDATYTVAVNYTVYDANGEMIGTVHALSQTVMLEKASAKAIKLGNVSIPEDAVRVDYTITVTDANGVIVDQMVPASQEVSPAIPLSVQDEFMLQMDSTNLEVALNKDPKALPGKGLVTTEVFSSLVKSAEGSVQQSMSMDRFAGLTVESQLLKALVDSSEQNPAELLSVYADLQSLLDDEGFIKYYQGANTGNFWLSAEMAQLLAMKPWAIAMMPHNLKSKMIESFVKVLEGRVSADYISGYGEASELQWNVAKVKAQNALLALDSQISLDNSEDMVAIMNATDLSQYSVETLTDITLLNAQRSPESVLTSAVMKKIYESYLSLKDKSAVLKGQYNWGWWGYSDEIVATSKLIKTLALVAETGKLKSSENYLDNLVQGVVQANSLNNWYTNRTKAWVLNGLTSFGSVFEADDVSGATSVSTDTSSLSTSVVWDSADQTAGMTQQWKADKTTVKVSHSGKGNPWVSVVAQSAVKLEKANYQGLKVSKEFKNLTTQDGSFSPGDLIQVTLKVESPLAQPHVALFDPIPAGANILTDGWGSYSSAQKSYEGYKVYFSYLAAGETQLNYQYQLNNPGKFNMAPTRVEALYEPGLFGEVPNATVEVK